MLKKLVLVFIATATAGCGGGGSASSSVPGPSATAVAPTTPASPPARPYPQSDQEIADLIYSASYRTPPGFYAEPVPSGANYVATAHLKNTDIDADGAAAVVHEACSDDWNQALEWSETAAMQMPSYGDLVETNSEARFFEFVRAPRATPTALVRQRVFQCSYLDRAGTDLRVLDGAGGRLNRRPLAPADVRQVAEYLWHFTAFNNFGNVVLASAPDTAQGNLAHGLTIATLQRATAPADCDRIDVVRWTHKADAVTGAITRSSATIATLRARESNGHATLCEVS